MARRSAARSPGWRRRSPRRRWRAGSSALRAPSFAGGLGLEQVVDAGRAAAQLPLGGLEQLQAGDAAQQLARLRAHPLGVGEVAGVVVGDAQRRSDARTACGSCSASSSWTSRDLGRERLRALAPLGVVGQQVAVVLHRRAAAGDVGHDRVEALVGGDRRARQPERLVLDAGVHLQRAAAARLRAGRGPPSPRRTSTRTVAALTSPKNTRWMQPCMNATVPRLHRRLRRP